MKFFTKTAFTIFIATLSLTNIAQAACDVANGDASITITVDKHIALGSLTRPDSGSATVTIDANGGARTLPPELKVGTNNPDVFNEAQVTVTGQAGCLFLITVTINSGSVTNLTFAVGTNPLIITNPQTLDATGKFVFTIGASATIDSTPTQQVGGDLTVKVIYI
jgi:hypothetical protein